MLLKYPGAKDIAKSRFDSFANLIESSYNGRVDRAKEIRNLARKSVGVYISAKAMELRRTIKLIQILDSDIVEIEEQIKTIIQDSPIITIPGITFRMAAMIQAEIGDFNRGSSPDKILAFSGLSPTTYQSGKYTSQNATMEKRGSRYLRYALFISAQYVSMWCPAFKDYYRKKRSEGNIILSLFLTLPKNRRILSNFFLTLNS
ncbi:MAG: IS110 family transposase [Selenomonadaceae bacterium]|nr:IS110 family transposase [Selenomonadaceae bacterium]